jgi:hypothetical protein
MKTKEKVVKIDKYDYCEFATTPNIDNKNVVAIYGVDDETLNSVSVGDTIKWQDEGVFFLGYERKTWNGQVYAFFQDYILIYIY